MPISELQIGVAGEYLVCADLILMGHNAFPSAQGLPFDVILEYESQLLKVQVKTTRGPKLSPQRASEIPIYSFQIGTNGKRAIRKKYERTQVDIFALVALDTKQIAYLPYFDAQIGMNFRVTEHRGKYHDELAVQIKKKVRELRDEGIKCQDVADQLGLSLQNVHRYSSNSSLYQRGTNAGVYFDSFTLERCLKALNPH